MQVKERMSAATRIVKPDDPIRAAARLMHHQQVEIVPVGTVGDLVGVVSARDLAVRCIAAGLDPNTEPVRRAMTLGVPTCSPDDDLDCALARMLRMQSNGLIVCDKNRNVVGAISISQLISDGVVR